MVLKNEEKKNQTIAGSYMKRALITGITGQDGTYLSELFCPKAMMFMA